MPKPSGNSSSKKLLSQIRSHISANEYDDALSLVSGLLQHDPTNYNGHIFHGLSLSALEQPTEALHAYQRAIDLRPDNPLAYKGLVQTLNKSSTPQDPLRLARANFRLASISTDHAVSCFPQACDAFFILARDDHSLVPEALTVLRAAHQSDAITPQSAYENQIVYQICTLLALQLPPLLSAQSTVDGAQPSAGEIAGVTSDPNARQAQLNSPPLSDALDTFTEILSRAECPDLYDEIAQLVIERALNNCLLGANFGKHLSILHRLSARDALLHLAETTLPVNLTSADCLRLATEAIAASPDSLSDSVIPTRAHCILAAHTYITTRDFNVAKSHLPASNSPSTRSLPSQPKPSFAVHSCTHALISAFFHLLADEYKLAIVACKAGISLATNNIHHARMVMLLTLISAAAFRGDRKYKSATKGFETVRDHARAVDDTWLKEAASRGLVDTAVVALGRTSRVAALSIEEAADTPAGLLESVWSDALAGDIDLERMSELTEHAIARTKSDEKNDNPGLWEHELLHEIFCWPATEVAAVASTRLAQMTIKEEGYTRSALAMSQKHHMAAAGLRKGFGDPFGHLGFIFEQFAALGDGGKMKMRAIRCYERVLSMDAAHPVASRQLARLLASRGLHDDAADVARQACDRNPQARWAFNLLGWHRVSRDEFAGAASAFQAALRGKPRRTAREEEALFGTDVGMTAVDNDLVVAVDSWRGLSAAYRVQGKMRAAVACLDDALVVLEKPDKALKLPDCAELSSVQKLWRVLVESEKNSLMVASRRSTVSTPTETSIMTDDMDELFTIGHTNAEACMLVAAEAWINGSYREACQMREEAAKMLQLWLDHFTKLQPDVNRAPVFKSLGDMWMEAVGETTEDVACLMSNDFVEQCLSEASKAYSEALRLSPSEKEVRAQDIAAMLLRQAVHRKDEELAKRGLRELISAQADGVLIAVAFATVASLSPSRALKKASREIAARVSSETKHRGVRHLLDASLAICAHTSEEVDVYAAAAVRATREDPTDWRAWYAVGKVREVDAERNGWDVSMVKSCEQAYGESERLGGGVAAVNSMLRCIERRLTGMQVEGMDALSYADARLGLSLAQRVGVEEPAVFREVVDAYQTKYGISDSEELQPGEIQEAKPTMKATHEDKDVDKATLDELVSS